MKRFVSLLLILALASLCLLAGGCSAKEDAIVGTWSATIDLAPILLESFDEEGEDITKYMELDSFDFSFTLCFQDDNTYTLSANEETFQKSMDKFVDTFTKAMVKYIEEMLKETGSGLTVEDYEKELGMTIEEYISSSYADTFSNHSIDTEQGEYTFDGSKLTMDGKEVFTIQLDKTTLTFTDYSGTDDENFAMLKGVVWKKG